MSPISVSVFFEKITSSRVEADGLLDELYREYDFDGTFHAGFVLMKAVEFLSRQNKELKEEIELLKKK